MDEKQCMEKEKKYVLNMASHACECHRCCMQTSLTKIVLTMTSNACDLGLQSKVQGDPIFGIFQILVEYHKLAS